MNDPVILAVNTEQHVTWQLYTGHDKLLQSLHTSYGACIGSCATSSRNQQHKGTAEYPHPFPPTVVFRNYKLSQKAANIYPLTLTAT
jgi:hypothetical protein